ncbi:TetR/AcrR family transcriptional regulator [Aurantimicrobium minutum]|uniref:TetR/AcrR family transcriptional regulator n=1 Tax=Aurantimicrobium minutum TaxID=708131 RepID=UPI002473C20A|nr:TetR family transcriptional regulator [Aurantimicrobium minutum]MDH6536877.1 AcrR family transcriptional regulator [Aurantimicrobium minutum]
MAKMTRAESTRLNDEAILSALAYSISDQGWDVISVSGVAKKAGVSVGAIYARAENLSELANMLWEIRLRTVIKEVLGLIAHACDSSSPELILRASSFFDLNKSTISPALELIIASQFDDELAEVIGIDFTNLISEMTVPRSSSLAVRHQAASRFLTLSFLFGRALAVSSGAVIEPLSYEEAKVLASFSRMKPEDKLESIGSPIFLKDSAGEGGEAELSILDVISKWGYRRATVSRMARAAGQTPGALISGFTSKADLVAEAARKLIYSPMEMWLPFEARISSEGSPKIRAGFLHGYLAPENRGWWKLNLELARVAETYQELEQFKTPADALQRTHLAVMFLALFTEGAADLPFIGPFRAGTTT